MYVKGLDPWCTSWPLTTFTVFIVTRMVEALCLNVKVYVLLIVPVNIGLFASGVAVFFYCADCLKDSMVIYLIVFSLQCIQMLIFICIVTIIIVEGISVRRMLINQAGFEGDREPLLGRGLDEEEIEEIVKNKPDNISKDETCSICLCEFEEVEASMQFTGCKHVFHQD